MAQGKQYWSGVPVAAKRILYCEIHNINPFSLKSSAVETEQIP